MKQLRHSLLASLPLIVTVFLVGCGKPVERAPWPAHVESWEGFSEEETQTISNAIDSMNEKEDKNMVDPKKTTGYKLKIKKVDPSIWPSARAGFATVFEDSCTVELSKNLFDDKNKKDYLIPVVWHEIGHCSGLSHDPKEGEIMSATTSFFFLYSSDVISRFMEKVKSSAGL